MKRNFYFVMALGLSFLICPAGALAEEPQDEAIDTMEEVVVTATKTEEKRKDVPNSVVIKNSMDIEEAPATSLGEVFANEPGLDWRTQGDFGGAQQSLQIRGFSSQGTQVLVNGINVNSPSLATADISRISLNSIDKVEVVKGPGSLLYGSGALGGTVNIITKRPKRDQIDLSVGAGYGTNDTYRLSAEHGMFAAGDFGYYITANRSETDGFRDNSDLTHNDVSLNLVYEKGNALDISLYGDYIDRDYGMPGVKPPDGTQPFAFNGTPVYNQESASLLNRGEDEDKHAVLKIKSNPLDWLGISLQGDYTQMESYFLNRYYTTFPAAGVPGTKTWVTNETLGVEGNFELRPVENASLLIGADYRDYSYDNKGTQLDGNGVDIAGSTSITKEGVYTKAAYIEAQWRPSPYFKLSAGTREQYHAYFGSETTPRFGLVVNPWESTALKATHGKHFRAPSMNDLFWPDDGFTKGNPDLVPETGWSTDVTLEQSLFEDKIFFNASYFKWDLDDKIAWAEDPSQPSPIFGNYWVPSNINQYTSDGYELGVKIGPFNDFLLGLGYTYLDTTEKLAGGVERQALNTPENLFKGSLTYWAPFDLTASVVVRYTSERPGRYAANTDKNASSVLEEYWTTDVKLEQRLFDHWKLALQGSNLFDEEYDTYIEGFTDATFTTTYVGYPGAGRSFFGSVTYEF